MRMNTLENQNAIFRMLVHEIQRLGSVSEATLRFEWTMEPGPGTNGWDSNGDGVLHLLRRVADPDYHVRHVEYSDGPIPGEASEETPRGLTPAEQAGFQVGDYATVIESSGSAGTEDLPEGTRLKLDEDDGTTMPSFEYPATGDCYWVALASVRREESPAKGNRAWQVGDRFKVVDTDGGHGFELGDVVELIARDEGSGLSIHDYQSVTTGSIAGVADYRLQRPEGNRPWQAGDRAVITQHGAGHGFPIGETVRLETIDGMVYRWRSPRTGDRWAVPPHCVRREDTPADDSRVGGDSGTLWQVGDRFEVMDSQGHPFTVGDTVELAEQDDKAEWRLQIHGCTIHEYRSINGGEATSVKSHRLRKLEPEEVTGAPAPDTPATRMGLRIGDRATVHRGYGGNSDVEPGNLVELIEDDETYNPYFRNLSNGREPVAITLDRVTPCVEEAPEPTVGEGPTIGEVWYVSIPMVPDGALVRMWVTSLSERVATLTPAAWASMAGRYAPEYGAEAVPMERDRVRFVERVQCAADQ